MIVLNHPPHGHALAAAMKSVFNPLGETCIARVEKRKLLGGVIYEGYTGTSVCMHACGLAPNWINRLLLWTAFTYPFYQLKVSKIILRIASTNAKSLALAKHLGFVEECRITDAVPDGDLLVLTMRRNACRWLQLEPYGVSHDGEKLSARSA